MLCPIFEGEFGPKGETLSQCRAHFLRPGASDCGLSFKDYLAGALLTDPPDPFVTLCWLRHLLSAALFPVLQIAWLLPLLLFVLLFTHAR